MTNELLSRWLQEACAIQQNQMKLLEQASKDFERHPDIRSELREHLLESRQQLDDLKECMSYVGAKPAAVAVPAFLAAGPTTLSASRPADRLIVDLRVLHATEHYEYISHRAVAEAARQMGQDEIADICDRMAEEAIAMAEWIEEQIPALIAAQLTTMHEPV